MKFTIQQSVLIKPLEQVARALPNRTTFPILENILFALDDDGLTLTASDNTTTIQAHVPANEMLIEETGVIAVPGKKIVDVVKTLNGTIAVATDSYSISLVSGKSIFKLSITKADEYPTVGHTDVLHSITIDGENLKQLIGKTVFCASKEETTPILTGVLVDVEPGWITFWATDRHRLARVRKPVDSDFSFKTVVPAESLNELLKLVANQDKIQLSYSEDYFVAKTDSLTYTARVLAGVFPDVSKLIPTNFNGIVKVNTKELAEILGRVLIIASEERRKNIIKITVDEDLSVEAKTDTGMVEDSIDCLDKQKDNFTIHMNGKYLQEALKVIDDEETTINFVGPTNPMIVHGVNPDESLHLLLPYRV